MPTYEYACTSCGERLEVVQRFSDDPLSVCPACAGALRKVFSPVGVVFKGSGFYKTDSRGSSSTKSGTDPKPSEPKTETTSTPADTKPSESSSSSSASGTDTTTKKSKPAGGSGERVA